MTDYRIVCTTQEPVSAPPTHAHIVAVGVGTDPNKADEKLTLQEVLTKMDRGDRFYTKGGYPERLAWVEKFWCTACDRWHIRSQPDRTTANNLDSLRTCNWR
jgi:hypothetical protein